MFTEFNRIFSLEVDLKNLEVTYNSKALYTNVDLNTSTMMIKMSMDQNALDLTGKTVNAFIKTGIDKNITMQRCEILEATEGIIGLDFKSSALKAGTNTFFLEIKSQNEEIINSPLITYKVVELFDTYSSIEGDNNVSILTELITEVDIAKGSVEVLKNEIAEQERQIEEAEASRKNNESSRIQAETNRTNSESTRVTNENNRNQAEITRESNETKRVSAENLRESAENTRQQEEIKRSQNESLRVESEKERVLSYEEIKNDNAIFKEQMNTDFGNAKTDYFGEEHPNVVERLNSDFDNLHQRMNNSSLLQYEGTNITANNSYYGLTKDMVVKGRTLQNLLTPNLFYDRDLWYTLNSNITLKDGYINASATGTFQNFYVGIEGLMVKPSTTYTIVLDIKENTLYSDTNTVVCYFCEAHTDNFIESSTKKYIFMGDVGIYKIIVKTRESFEGSEVYLKSFINKLATSGSIKLRYAIIEGDHTNTPIEDLPFGEGIYSVGENEITEDGKYKISGKSCGKNIIDIDYVKIENMPVNQWGYIEGTAWKLNVPCKPNTRYYMKYKKNSANYRVCVIADRIKNNFEENESHGSVYGKVNNSTGYEIVGGYGMDSGDSFVTPEWANYLHFTAGNTVENTNSKPFTYELSEIMISEVDEPYEPYQESTYSYILNEPLRSLPNGVADTIEGNKVIRRVGKVVLDGSWAVGAMGGYSNDEYTEYYISPLKLPYKAKSYTNSLSKNNSMCDTLPVPKNTDVLNQSICEWGFVNGLGGISIRISNSKLSTPDITGIFKWLSQTPTTIYYELEEPIIEELDETLQLKSFEGITHIISDNYLMPITSAKIPSNVQAVVSSLITENKELTEEVSTLSVENEELKQTNEIQDELIDINMCATDEMYVLLEPLLAQSISTMSLEREVSKMVDLYVAMIQRGLKTIEQVPERYREQVREVLEQLEK